MEVESVTLEEVQGKLRERGTLAFAEVVLTDENGEKIILRGLRVYKHPLSGRVKILYPRHPKKLYTFFSPQGRLMQRINDAILAKFSEVCELEELMQLLDI